MKVELYAADAGGCGHYRLIWPGEAAYYAGADVTVIMPEDGASRFHAASASFEKHADGGPLIVGLKRVPDADVVVVQRPLTRVLVDVVKLLQAAGIAIVVEVDDDFEAIDPNNAAWPGLHPELSPKRNWAHLAECCRVADLVTVTTPALADIYGRHGRVAVIPNMVPSLYLHVLADPHDDVRVGWTGNVSTHPRDLQVTRGAVARVLRRHDLRFHLIGDGRITRPDGTEVIDYRVAANLGLGDDQGFAHTGWLPLDKYPRGIAELDIGIVPLDDTRFNNAKSYLKGLEFAAVGRPFVASPTAPYRTLEAAGIGQTARRPRDWERFLDRLVVDADYRAELGDLYRRRVAASHVIEHNVDRWLNAWRSALDNAAKRRKVGA